MEQAMYNLALWTFIATVVGGILALLGIFVAIKTLRESATVAREQFLVTMRSLFANYDDVHAKLRPAGQWATEPPSGPSTAAEWARVELYMGTFEHCENLLRRGLLDEEEFRKGYGYRLANLLANPVIVEEKLVKRGVYWTAFRNLCKRLDIALPDAVDQAERSA